MGAFDLSKIEFVDCEAVLREYSSDPFNRGGNDPVRVNYDLFQDVLPMIDRGYFLVWIIIAGVASDGSGVPLAKCRYVFRGFFTVEDIGDIVQADPETKVRNIDTDAIAVFLSTTLSTARGQLQTLLSATPFRYLPLPLVPVHNILRMAHTDVRDLIPDWAKDDYADVEAGTSSAPE